METIILIIFSAFGIGFLFAIYKIFSKLNDIQAGKDKSQDAMIVGLNQRVENLSDNLENRLQRVTELVVNQLDKNTTQVDSRLQSSNRDWVDWAKEIRGTIDENIKTIGKVTDKLSQMEEAHKRIYEVGKDIASLQEILRAPKLRGTLGEFFLEDLLSQVVPKERYKMQYAFKSGETVDAVLVLKDNHLISIDSKFPLESFKRMIEVVEESGKKKAKKEFEESVKKRIDEIAQKYIVPDEGTFDFALMYIPAENVYYETIIRGGEAFDIAKYAYEKRVIPVSPNNLYVYLQTIAFGLRGMQIEEKAREILQILSQLNADFSKVISSYEVLGKHLSSASARYEETAKILTRFGIKIEQIESKTGGEPKMLDQGEKQP